MVDPMAIDVTIATNMLHRTKLHYVIISIQLPRILNTVAINGQPSNIYSRCKHPQPLKITRNRLGEYLWPLVQRFDVAKVLLQLGVMSSAPCLYLIQNRQH